MRRHLKLILSVALLSSWLGVGAVRAADTIFPSTKGSTWTYKYSNGKVLKTAITASGAHHFTEKISGQISMVVRFKLSPKGWIFADVGKVQTQHINGQRIKVKILRASGVVIPRTHLWKKGYRWSFSMNEQSKVGNGADVAVIDTNIRCECKIMGFRTIKVPAGKFHCLRVRTTQTSANQFHIMNQIHTQDLQKHSTEYYARGVGLVEVKTGTIIRKLTRYHISG